MTNGINIKYKIFSLHIDVYIVVNKSDDKI